MVSAYNSLKHTQRLTEERNHFSEYNNNISTSFSNKYKLKDIVIQNNVLLLALECHYEKSSYEEKKSLHILMFVGVFVLPTNKMLFDIM